MVLLIKLLARLQLIIVVLGCARAVDRYQTDRDRRASAARRLRARSPLGVTRLSRETGNGTPLPLAKQSPLGHAYASAQDP